MMNEILKHTNRNVACRDFVRGSSIGLVTCWLFVLTGGRVLAEDSVPLGWTAAAPRDEIRPTFAYDAAGGRNGNGAFIIQHDGREGLDGYWTKTFPVQGGTWYHFEAFRRVSGVRSPRRAAAIRLIWQDDQGKLVDSDRGVVGDYLRRSGPAKARPEYPTDKATNVSGWTEVSDTYHAPPHATRAVVELHLLWAPGGKIWWSNISLKETRTPKGRKVRLASVHFRPQGGKSPAGNCRLFKPLIEQAARQKADLVVLGETVTYVGLGKTPAEVAESVPGASTEYFGRLARKHDLYIVVGLYERVGHLVYNVAVLIGPDGEIAGK